MKDTAKKPILVIMAAGMGSRFGGLKQIEACLLYTSDAADEL